MWQALRYRGAQTAALVLLSALVTACAVLAPLYSRALEQGLLQSAVFRASPADTALVVSAGRTATSPDLGIADVLEAVPAKARELHEDPVGQLYGRGSVKPRAGLMASPLELVYRDRVCEHLTFIAGGCPREPGEVAVSAEDYRKWGWRFGQAFSVPVTGAPTGTPPVVLTIAGAYDVRPDPAYWLRTQLDGRSGTLVGAGNNPVPALDTWVASESTFDQAFPNAQITVALPLKRSAVTLDSLPEAAAAAAAVRSTSGSVTADSPVPALLDQVRAGQGQVAVIVPILMVQLGLLAAVVLLAVAGAAVDQRRPEVALARLRGRSREGARRLVLGELGFTVLLGLPVGTAIAIGVSELARRLLLPRGVPFELTWQVAAAVGVAWAVCMGAVVVAAQPVLREPISSQLRRVEPTSGSRGWPVVDLVVVALAVAGIAGLATRTMTGPLALLTPTLASLALGLVLAHVLVPVSAAWGRRSLQHGRVAAGLAALSLSRRPALRRILTISTVATALAVFAANAVLVADRNRQARAELEAGAPVTLRTDSTRPDQLRAALVQADPSGRSATPVAIVRHRDTTSTPTMAVLPDGFAAVSYPVTGQRPFDLGRLAPPRTATVNLSGARITAEVVVSMRETVPEGFEAPAWYQQPPYQPPPAGTTAPGDPKDLPPLPPARLALSISVTGPDGEQLSRDLAGVALDKTRRVAVDAPLLCPGGCRLDGIEARVSREGDFPVEATGRITLRNLAVDGRPLRVGEASRWLEAPANPSAPSDLLRAATASSPDALVVDVANSGFVQRLAYGDVPAAVPALLAGPVPPGGTAQAFTSAGLNGAPVTMARAQDVAAIPVLGDKGALVSFETLARLGGQIPQTASLQVWLKDDSPALLQRVTDQLQKSGVAVVEVRRYSDLKRFYDESASGWGLQLAMVVGVLGLLIATLVMAVVAVTGWRRQARDYAALRMAGVSQRDLRRATRREQLLVVTAGVAAGAVAGALGAALAMPLIPLFNRPASVPVVDLAPSWAAMGLAWVCGLLLLVGAGLAIARALAHRYTLSRIREDL